MFYVFVWQTENYLWSCKNKIACKTYNTKHVKYIVKTELENSIHSTSNSNLLRNHLEYESLFLKVELDYSVQLCNCTQYCFGLLKCLKNVPAKTFVFITFVITLFINHCVYSRLLLFSKPEIILYIILFCLDACYRSKENGIYVCYIYSRIQNNTTTRFEYYFSVSIIKQRVFIHSYLYTLCLNNFESSFLS